MRSRLLTVLAVVVMAFLLVTNPTVGQAAGKITGKQIKDGSVTGKDIKDGSLTSKDVSGSLAGPAGPAGPTGPAGAPATALWGVVKANAVTTAVERASGVTAVARLSAGTYTVTFNRSIIACAYVATAGDVVDFAAPTLFATVEQFDAESNPNAVEVRTFDDAGVPTDSPDSTDGFHVAVFC